MPLARATAIATVLVAAVLAQTAVLPWLPLPGPAPDRVLVAVVGLALAGGPRAGAGAGFAAGLLLDLAPPADHAVGRWALTLCLVGHAAGLAGDAARSSGVARLLVVGLAAALAPVAYALTGALLGDPRSRAAALLALLPGQLCYALLLTPVVVPAMIRLVHGRRARTMA
jgi:rod shape-determining protein MreD